MRQRTFANNYDCPYCGAQSGNPCKGIRRPIRLAMHKERHDVALKDYKLWLNRP